MKKQKNIFIIVFITVFMLICCRYQNIEKIKAETSAPELTIVSHNISYSDYIYLMVAVNVNNIDSSVNSVKLLFWDSEQTEYLIDTANYTSLHKGSTTVNGKYCLIYYSNGIAAKEMADDIYMRAYVEIDGVAYYSEVTKYSVVQYVEDRINSGNYTEQQYNLYKAMLEYGAAAQIVLNYNTDNLANSKFNSKTSATLLSLKPSLNIVSYNLSYSECLYIMVAVGTNNIDENLYPIKLLMWDSEQTEYTIDNANYMSSKNGNATVNGQNCLIFYSKGIVAKEMANDVYLCAYVEVDGVNYYSDVIKYSVVQYVSDKINSGKYTEAQSNLYNAMLEYGSAAQILFNHNISNLANANFVNVSVEDGYLANGTSNSIYKIGQTVTVTAKDYENKIFKYWQDELGNIISSDKEYEFTASADIKLIAVYTNIIDITINTKNLSVTNNIDSSWYTVSAKNSSDLVYIIVTITIVDESYYDALYKVIINNKEISETDLEIINNQIIYSMDDPNWSDFV